MNSASDAYINNQEANFLQRCPGFVEGDYQRYSSQRDQLTKSELATRAKIARLEATLYVYREKLNERSGADSPVTVTKAPISPVQDAHTKSLETQLAKEHKKLSFNAKRVRELNKMADVKSAMFGGKAISYSGRYGKEQAAKRATNAEKEYQTFEQKMKAATKGEMKLREKRELAAATVSMNEFAPAPRGGGLNGLVRRAYEGAQSHFAAKTFQQTDAALDQMKVEVKTLEILAKGKTLSTGQREESFKTYFDRTVRVKQLEEMEKKGISL